MRDEIFRMSICVRFKSVRICIHGVPLVHVSVKVQLKVCAIEKMFVCTKEYVVSNTMMVCVLREWSPVCVRVCETCVRLWESLRSITLRPL